MLHFRALASLVVLYSQNYSCMWPKYTGITTTLRIGLKTPKNLYLNQVTQKNYSPNILPKEIPELKISNVQKSFDHSCHLRSGVPILGLSSGGPEFKSRPGHLLDLFLVV